MDAETLKGLKVGAMIRDQHGADFTVFEVVGLPKPAGEDRDKNPADGRLAVCYLNAPDQIRRVDPKHFEVATSDEVKAYKATLKKKSEPKAPETTGEAA